MTHAHTPGTNPPLEVPTTGRALRILGRLARLRCPHCGVGRVLKWDGGVHMRCSGCNLRFQRGDGHYFFGAMFFGVMLGELLFALTFAAILVSTWPDVPWKLLQWGLPIGVVLAAPLFIPFSKLVFLSVDVFVRPVTTEECLELHETPQ
jgi:uncharacterized protein (DUF983 family)